MDPGAVLALLRFLHAAAAMLLWGACGYLAVLVRGPLAEETGRRLRFVLAGAALVVVVAATARLPVETAAIGDGWSDALDPANVDDVLTATTVGTAWQVQVAAASALAATWLLSSRRRVGAQATAAGLVLASLTLVGHSSMHAGRLGLAHRANDMLHLLSGGAWLGALVPLLPLLRLLADPERRGSAGEALRRFSNAGHVAVALVLATGATNTALVLGRWPLDWSTSYQALLVVKIGLVLAMTALALVNRYVLVRRIRTAPAEAVRAIRAGTMAEIVLGVVVLALVSVFGLLEPA